MAFRASATYNSGAVAVTSASIPNDPAVQVGDVATLVIANPDPALITTAAAGWTTRVADTVVGTMLYSVFTRTVQAGDTAAAFTLSAGKLVSAVVVWETSNGVDAVGTPQPRPASQATTVAPSMTASSASDTVLAILVEKTTGLNGAPTLSKGTQRAFVEVAAGAVCSITVAEFTPASTTTGDLTATYTTANTNGVGVQVALLPAFATIPIVAASAPTSSASLALNASRPLTLTSPGSALAALVISRAVPLTMSSTATSSAAAPLVRSASLTISSLALSQPFLILGNASPVELSALAEAAASLVLTSIAPLALSVSASSIVRLRLPASAHDSGVTERRSTAGSTESLRLAGPTQALEGAPTYG